MHFFARAGDRTCRLYFKPIMIVNDDSRVINKLETSHSDDARVVIYNRHMFIVQATVIFLFLVLSVNNYDVLLKIYYVMKKHTRPQLCTSTSLHFIMEKL